MKKQSIKRIALSRMLKVFFLSILVVLSVIVLSYRSFFQLVAENKAISIAEVIKAGLTSHMKAGIMDKRAYFLNEISSVYDIESINIIRADIVSRQFGEPGDHDNKLDDDLRKLLEKKEPSFTWKDRDSKIEAIIPYIASSKGTLNCLQCHQVNDNDVLGAVNISMDTGLYQDFAFKYSYMIAAVLLFFVLVIVLDMFHVLEYYIRRPLTQIVDDGQNAYNLKEDVNNDRYKSREFDAMVQNINDFNQHILGKEKELKEKNLELQNLNEEIESTLKDTLQAMGQIEELRSGETKQHTNRVSTISALIAIEYGLDEEQVKLIELASSLHDIGKIGIADAILNKPEKLTDEEFTVMKTHTAVGYEILRHSKRPVLQAAASIAYGHHEKYDGTGYPLGLQGKEIDIFARIVAIVDVIDALLSKRVYKEIWSVEKVVDFLKKERGRHFEPKLVDIVLENMDEYTRIIGDMSEESWPGSG
ncbi:MAG: HD domain-containing phosphohydrolase [Campylobacterota bacterium]